MINLLSGCIILIVGFFIFLFIFKIWFIAFLFLLIALILAKGVNFSKNISFSSQKEFVTKPGEVYKECSFCGTKAERRAVLCNNCGRSFE